MIFTKTPLEGAWVIDLDPHIDARGFFARSFCQREFAAHGLNPEIRQCNLSLNHKAGTLRGMHFQRGSGAEAKLVRCVRGAIHDVIIDLRSASETYGHHFAIRLDAGSRRALFVPESFAHGFQTLQDETEIEYQMTDFYAPEYAAGYRYDDPAFAIAWPLPVRVISEQDLAWPTFSP